MSDLYIEDNPSDDPEFMDEREMDRREIDAELRAEVRDEVEYIDPFEFHFMPGYPTEMDYLNSLEADDYRDEFGDGDVEF